MGKRLLGALAVAIVAAAPASAAERSDKPVCPGGTSLVETRGGSDHEMVCKRRDGTKQGPYVIVFAPTGRVRERGEHHNNRRHGPFTSYHVSGERKESGEFREGVRHGYWTRYHSNGQRASAGEYSDGQERGRWMRWDEKGRPLEEGDYRDGKKHGFWTIYDPATGKPKRYVEYSNGVERPSRP